MKYMDYNNYIYSEMWFDKRNLFMKLHGKSCFICGTIKGLVCHHLHYKTLCNEKSRDLRAVCIDCHNIIHNNKLKGDLSQWNFDNTKDGKIIWE